MLYDKVDEIRFWSSIQVKAKKDCWWWRKSRHIFGYGWFRIKNKTYLAHRLALIFFTGKEHKNKLVLHKCNNPHCCNPFHLKWGTQKENIQDSIKAGTKVDPPRNGTMPPVYFGENNKNAVMTKEKVIKMREEKLKGVPIRELSKKYNISKSTVYQILRFITWKNI